MDNSVEAAHLRGVSIPASERFWRFVDKTENCWIWTGWRSQSGYGRFGVGGGNKVQAHRFSYEMTNGQIPAGLQIDHLCRNRLCVNPLHLEPVTARENVKRSTAAEVLRKRKAAITHCPMGHPYSPENTTLRKDKFGRECKLCGKLRGVKHRRSRGVKEVQKATIDGQSKSITDWAKQMGIGRCCIHRRIKKGWTAEEAILTPRRCKP